MITPEMSSASAVWLWEKFGAAIIKRSAAAMRAGWKQFSWTAAEERYRNRLIEICGTTKLLGNPRSISIEDIYTHVEVLDQVSAFRRLELERRIFEKGEQEIPGILVQRRSAEALAGEKKRVYVLGKPGCGKTTLLKHLTIQACRGRIKKTPVFISLKEWVDRLPGDVRTPDPFDAIVQAFEMCGFPDAGLFAERLMAHGDALVMFDGLDEVVQDNNVRSRVIGGLRDFARKHSKTDIWVTCRIAATTYSFDQFTYVEIADFSDGQKKEFIRKWYSQQPAAHHRFVQEWSKPDNVGLRELSKTPLLLALLCLAFDENLEFPTRRADLYKEALDALFKKWDVSRLIIRDEAYRQLSVARKEQLLARIAARNFFDAQYFIKHGRLVRQIQEFVSALPAHELKGEVDGESVLNAIEVQHGIFVERAQGVYSFSHLTLQEYLTARYIIENPRSEGIASLLTLSRVLDDRWREVIVMAASIVDDATVFLDEFLSTIQPLIEGKVRLLEFMEGAKRSASTFLASESRWDRPRGASRNLSITSVIEAGLDLASELHFSSSKNMKKVLNRVRFVCFYLHAHPREAYDRLGAVDCDAFAKYLRACKLLAECLHVTAVKNRSAYELRILDTQ